MLCAYDRSKAHISGACAFTGPFGSLIKGRVIDWLV